MAMRRTRCLHPLLALALAIVAARPSSAGVETTLDNDTDAFVPGHATTDRNYTQGGRMVWYGAPGDVPLWARAVASRMAGSGAVVRTGYAVGQEIYTPDAISYTRFIADDRPYAGWLYGTAFVSAASERRERTVELQAGMIGPASGACEAQKWWHGRWSIRTPRGWNWQLRNEPGLVARIEERRRPWGYQRHADAIPYVGGSLGNVLTEAHTGAIVRFGAPLPDDFGVSRTTAPTAGRGGHTAAWLFARAEGRAVARNLFLDGSTFGDSPRVSRIPLVGEAQFGAGVRWHSLGVRYLFSYVTNEFRERPNSHEYGSIAISF